MKPRWYVGTAVAVVLALGTAASGVRAQAPAPAALPGQEPWAVIEYGAGTPRPAVVSVAATSSGTSQSGHDWLRSRPRRLSDRIHDCMHQHGVGCWSHFNSYTCGSWKSECKFIFGSCREFFGEPCLPGPPPPPYPPGYVPPGAYGAAGYGMPASRSGCPSCQ